ncbi:hypothetical protein ACFL1N_12125 [Thermodesulfobacteriota bacterium]
MSRVTQPKETKGSLKWIQDVINDCPILFNNTIHQAAGFGKWEAIEWLSPREDDEYSEYRDKEFLDLLEIELPYVELSEFWPSSGPQWDALGRAGNDAYFLVEAKAHVTEMIVSSQAKSPESKTLIEKSLNEIRAYLELNPEFDLTKDFYQYVNRLAHLYLLRILNNVPVYLVFVYFLNDYTHVPTSKPEWDGALNLMHSLLGTEGHNLSRYVIDVFIDVRNEEME